MKDWNIKQITGYEPKTTIYMDFSIADSFGVDAIKDTFNRVFDEWKNNHIYFTEFVMALNWKIWEHYEKNEKYAELYNELWGKADMYACENFTGDELTYFYQTTD